MDLLKKKRPMKLKYADQLALGLGLSESEKVYFKTLIQMEKAADEEKTYLEEVLKSLRPQDEVVDKNGGVFSHWLNVVIFTLSQLHHFSMSLQEIKASLKQDVSLKTIEDSLNLLVEQKLLELTPEGNYRRCQMDFISTQNDVSMKTSHAYYSQIISKAQSAVKMGVEEREFQCFAIGMKKENLVKIKEVMRKARKDIASFSDEQGDHVYQFNLNGFPMAEIPKYSRD
jgi:uncharacterized protein (TIGR02147 family)